MFTLRKLTSAFKTQTIINNFIRHSHPAPSHGTIFMKATTEPKKSPEELGMDDIKKRVEETDYSKLSPSQYRTEDDYFDESDPLCADMLELEPPRAEGTIIWLLGLGDTHQKSRPIFEMLRTHNIRWCVPNPPTLPLTALDDGTEKAWFDVMSNKYKEEDGEDYEGIKHSMFRLHQLIHEEADLLGKIHAPVGTDPIEARKIGAKRIVLGGFGQGAALALFSGIRYPHKLNSMVSFSGYMPHIQETIDAFTNVKDGKGNIQDNEDGSDTNLENVKITEQMLAPPNLKTPIYVAHGEHDDAIPWREFALPRYIKANAPPLNLKMYVRPSFEMGHFMGNKEMMEMHYWITQRIENIDKE